MDVDDEEKESQPTTVAMMMTASAHHLNKLGSDASLSSFPISRILGTNEEQQLYNYSAAAGINISPSDLVLKQLFDMEPTHLQRCNEEAALILLEELRYKNTPTPLPHALVAAPRQGLSCGSAGSESSNGVGSRKKQRVFDIDRRGGGDSGDSWG